MNVTYFSTRVQTLKNDALLVFKPQRNQSVPKKKKKINTRIFFDED